MKKVKNVLKKISSIFNYILILISLIIYFVCEYIMTSFPDTTIDQLLFSAQTAGGTSDTMFIDGAKYVFPRIIIIILVFVIIKLILKKVRYTNQILSISFNTKTIKISLLPLSSIIKFICSIIISGLVLYISFNKIGFVKLLNQSSVSNYIEDNYVNPKSVKIEAPENKQNLIYIYVESLESSLFSLENGGNFNSSVIPNLEELALNNINFSNKTSLGGAYVPYGSGWTIAGMVSSTAGVPLKLPFGSNDYTGEGKFLPGAYSLGDILKEYGYHNYLLIGSDAEFGGRKSYFDYHGDYEIYDYNYAKENSWIDSNYHEWWGYEDKKLYEFAKNILNDISEDEPFNLTMLTADTHATDGYVDETCKTVYDQKYLNAYNCTDKMLGNFIEWIQEQDFYENTTIVIVGDHLTMQGNIFDLFDADEDKWTERKTYNTIINSRESTENNKNRNFTTFDLYPTVLSSLGFKIEGDRLGLGTNLFSDKKTLLEKSNYDDFNSELEKKSAFYEEKIFNK